MSYKIAHLSDIHFRSLKRHDEYKEVFAKVFEKIKEEKVDSIFIGGDIVHSKTQGITPELIDVLNWWFTNLAQITQVHVILGNHDGLILNKDRQDAISPIISALNNKNIHLYKKSGVYPSEMKDINWCVFSCFDEENWDKVKPVDNKINIACFHGAVWGSKTDIDWELDGEVSLSFFDNFDFGFLGDIHKKQFLDKEKRVAYPGSTIQQNFGEDVEKGFLVWEIENKHDFSAKFIKIDNPYAFVTVEWQGNLENTIQYLANIKKGVRYRIRTKEEISQAEIKVLHHYLKTDKKAKEIVYQNLSNNNFENKSSIISEKNTFNIRSKADRLELLKDYYSEVLTDQEFEELDKIFQVNLDKIPKSKLKQNNKWSVNSLKWDNTFSYGKDNEINFNKLNGVVGLFGNNRVGKSSIPGTLMYTLFNSTDRGSLKNLNVVNIRKGECQSTANITVGTDNYNIIRKTTKKTNKKTNTTSATTKLFLEKVDKNNEIINETEEQRRETEKILQDLIGTSEDFLYTSFASQGEINTFIKEKSTARKNVLSKFLELEIFDTLYKDSREDYIVLKNKLKQFDSESDFQVSSDNFHKDIDLNNTKIFNYKNKISKLREVELSVKVQLNEISKNNKKHPSGHTVDSAEKEIEFINEKINKISSSITENCDTIQDLDANILKIKEFKKNYSIEKLEEEELKLDNLKKKLQEYKSTESIFNNEIKRNTSELKILDDVPCEDNFPSCKFIKKAHEAKNKNKDLIKNIDEIQVSILEIKSVINKIDKEDIKQKIKKFRNILNKEYKFGIDIENLNSKNELLNNKLILEKENLLKLTDLITELKNFSSIETIKKEEKLKLELTETQKEIQAEENLVHALEKENFYLENKIIQLEEKKKEYDELVKTWKLYDIFTTAVSKKGIPSILINSYLPKINKEINDILGNSTTFTISMECEENNNLNVYIDYGDSKRIIECASGMEKMMTSIAIRVALINISNLPKSDMFIIDEGFGALDASNIEACSRLLTSIKKYFKTIIIISHIDAIKDIVDKNIEISIKGNNSYVCY